MKTFNFKKIDAFATRNSYGNPAGYILLNHASEISDGEMQQIAKELKGFVNEVGYVVQTSENSFNFKYYSSEREVDFCGHATIAIMYDLLKNNSALQEFEILQINTNKGKLSVENRIKEEDAVFIMAPKPQEYEHQPDPKELASQLKISMNEIENTLLISVINAGLKTLLVPIKTLSSTLGIKPELEELKSFCVSNNIDIIEVFSRDTADKSNNFRSRVFAPTFGYLEDPATGSGNSALGYYLIKNQLWNQETIRIEQNGSKDKFNIVKLQKLVDKNGNKRILFGGGAITRIQGEYLLSKK